VIERERVDCGNNQVDRYLEGICLANGKSWKLERNKRREEKRREEKRREEERRRSKDHRWKIFFTPKLGRLTLNITNPYITLIFNTASNSSGV
jgi:hypothetical protein